MSSIAPRISGEQYREMIEKITAGGISPAQAILMVDAAMLGSGVTIAGGGGGRGSYGSVGAGGFINSNPTKNTGMMARSKKFNNGDEVVLKSLGSYSYSRGNPEWGRDGLYVSGRVTEVDGEGGNVVQISWSNGTRNGYLLTECEIVLLESVKPEKVAGKNLDLKQMERLVIDEVKRADIISVIKQHENHAKLFDDWGLGEVIEYGKGMVMLFWGPPGTGKTWAAVCIAKTLGAELLSIGAAEIETSEPGGANRNLQNAFKAAQSGGKVLFIDECDSLVTSRKQVGMIIGGQINTLLQEIEKFEGVCILATNRIEELDEALERRISLILEFPEPNFDGRMQIWERMLPKKMPLEAGVDAKKLAEFKLTGGQIKNVLLAAARSAMSGGQDKVLLADFEKAVYRIKQSSGKMGTRALQYEKMGKKTESMDYGRTGGSIGKERVLTTDKVEGTDKVAETL